MGFSRQEYWNGVPLPPPGNLPHPEAEPTSLLSPALASEFFTTSATWEAQKWRWPRLMNELTQKRPWCWERLKAGEGENRGWSPTQRTWVWANSGKWWRTGKPGLLQSMESQRIGDDWATEPPRTNGMGEMWPVLPFWVYCEIKGLVDTWDAGCEEDGSGAAGLSSWRLVFRDGEECRRDGFIFVKGGGGKRLSRLQFGTY